MQLYNLYYLYLIYGRFSDSYVVGVMLVLDDFSCRLVIIMIVVFIGFFVARGGRSSADGWLGSGNIRLWKNRKFFLVLTKSCCKDPYGLEVMTISYSFAVIAN